MKIFKFIIAVVTCSTIISNIIGAGGRDDLLTRKRVNRMICLISLLLLLPISRAELLSFSFTDNVNDPLGCPPNTYCYIPFEEIEEPVSDLLDAYFTFSNTTGNYCVVVNTTEDSPFTGRIRINMNLFNGSLSEYFFDNVNDFFFDSTATQIIISGTELNLLSWDIGHSIASCEGPGGILAEHCVNGLGAPTDFGAGLINFNGSVLIAIDSFQTASIATVANTAQEDNDGDEQVDACDTDDDNDSVLDGSDNCPLIANIGQSDSDTDGIGDACDSDIDGDGVDNSLDVCASTPLGEAVETSKGCSIAQLCPCDGPLDTATGWDNHGKFMSCMTQTTNSFVEQGLIPRFDKSRLGSSECGHKN